jgi:hypothetical protein
MFLKLMALVDLKKENFVAEYQQQLLLKLFS